MSRIKALQERKDEITAEMQLIAATAGGFNRAFSSGELSRRKALANDLKAVSKKIEETRAADDLIERIAEATPDELLDDLQLSTP